MNHINVLQLYIGYEAVQTVSARALHASLGINKEFSTWIKARIKGARLVENSDFLVFTQKGENSAGDLPVNDYHLTLEAAKHISILSGSEQGFEMRNYLRNCEKQFRKAELEKFSILQSAVPAAKHSEGQRLLGEHAKRIVWKDDFDWHLQVREQQIKRPVWHANQEYIGMIMARALADGLQEYSRLLMTTEKTASFDLREEMLKIINPRFNFMIRRMSEEVPFTDEYVEIWYTGNLDDFRGKIRHKLALWETVKDRTLY